MRTSKENHTLRAPDEVGDVIRDSQAEVKAIVLNVCQGAKSAAHFIGGADYVIGWKTNVDDDAAVLFSEQYYKSIRDGSDVVSAYFQALTNMRALYDWRIDMVRTCESHRREIQATSGMCE